MEAALVPLVDRIERGLARLEADGWKVPSDRSRPVEIAIVSAPGEGAIAGTRRGGGPVVQVDIGMVPVDALDRLAPQILHQLAHLFLSSYARTDGSWWAESTARHLAGRAEESGLPKPAATPEGLVGPASPEGFGEREFADAVASSIGESGLVRIWEEARGGPAEDSLRKTFERLAGKSLEEFVLEQALARESAATSARTPVSSAPGTSEWNAGVPKGAAWWVSRFRPDGSGGGEVLLDPAAGDFAVRLVVAYRAADRVPDVVERPPRGAGTGAAGRGRSTLGRGGSGGSRAGAARLAGDPLPRARRLPVPPGGEADDQRTGR